MALLFGEELSMYMVSWMSLLLRSHMLTGRIDRDDESNRPSPRWRRAGRADFPRNTNEYFEDKYLDWTYSAESHMEDNELVLEALRKKDQRQ